MVGRRQVAAVAAVAAAAITVSACAQRTLLSENRGATSQRLITSAVQAALDDVDFKPLHGVPSAITIGHLTGRGGSSANIGADGPAIPMADLAVSLLRSIGLGRAPAATHSPGMGADVHPGAVTSPESGLEPVTGVFADYLHSHLRAQLGRSGVPLVPHRDAKAHIVLLVDALGSDEDRRDGFLRLWNSESIQGEAWFRLVAFDPAGDRVYIDQPIQASRYFKHTKILGFGPFQQTNLPETNR